MTSPGVAEEAHPVVSSALDLDLLRTLLDDGADGIVLIGADAALEFMSPGALRLFDADGLAAFAGRSFVDLWSQADRPGVEAALAAARSGVASRVQAKGMTIQGCEGRWDLVVRPLRTGTGEARRAVAVVRDVTDLLQRKAPVQADKRAGENKADRGGCVCQGSEALLRSALNTMDQGLMLIDADERVSLCNVRAVELLDLPPELMATCPPFEEVRKHQLETGEFIKAGKEILEFALRAGFNAAPQVYERVRPDGTNLEIRTAALPGGGVVRTYTDITARRRAEREREVREERYRLAARATNDAIWDWDLGTDRVDWNEALGSLFGYATSEVESDAAWWKERIHPDDRARVVESIAAYLESESPQWSCEYRFRRADGSYAEVLDRAYTMRDPQGRPLRMVGAMQDLTSWRRAQGEIERLAKQLNDILESTTDAVGFVDRDWRITYVNGRAARELSGTGDLVGHRVWDAFPEAVGGPFAALCEETMNGGPGGSVEAFNKRLRTWYDLHVRPSGQGLAVFFRNITAQREAREALRRSERLLQSALDTGRIVAWDCDLETGFVLRSGNSPEVLGFGSGPGAEFIERIHPDDRTRFDEAWDRAVAEGTFHVEVRFRKPDGSWIWLDERGKLESRADGRAVRVVGLAADITARKLAEIEAREKAALLEMTLEHMDQGLLVVDADRRIPLWNRRALELLGLPGELLKSDLTIDEIIGRQVEAGEFAGADPALQKAVATGDFLQAPPVYQRVRPNGTVLEVRTAPLSNGGAVRTYTDATARRAAEHLIAESERRYRLLAENATDMIVRMEADGVRRYVSPASRELLGYEPDEMLGKDISWLVHPDELATVSERLEEMLSGHRNQDTVTYRARHRNNQWVWLESHRRLIRDQAGRPHEVVSVVRNISERRRLEEQLRQSQKMEAVGQLTGGIAHDFNNLLTVILGNAEILVGDLGDPHHRSAAEIILGAAERGAGLTQQLLAFGRRQTLQTERLHPAEVIEGMVPLLRRTIGEHIVLRTEFAAGQGWALADRTLLESAILNLAINARDAMPQGGSLGISTDHVVIDATDQPLGAKPGRYVALTVSDTGIGMSSEVQERAFEPFFTTKEVGKGSGLGLSMVYGFAKQSGGHVGIRSAPGQGTSVTVLLPLAGAESALSEIQATPSPAPTARIRVLVVEDEAEVRRFVTSLLLTLGHDVVEAGTGLSGLQVLLSDTTIDLLLTDVVLPGGMSGVELARRAQAARPGLRVLLTSGYPEEVFQEQGRPDAGTMILQKPYRRHELAEAVSRVLAPAVLLAEAS